MTTVAKIEAVSRQLDTAIHLFFSGGDSISVHMLAAGAVLTVHECEAVVRCIRELEKKVLPDRQTV